MVLPEGWLRGWPASHPREKLGWPDPRLVVARTPTPPPKGVAAILETYNS
jgi:hypothetical protein